MGKMSFDRCTRILSFIRENIKPMVESDVETQDEALERALEIIRKYQKIEQILKNIPYGGEATVRRIQEVVEDGRI